MSVEKKSRIFNVIALIELLGMFAIMALGIFKGVLTSSQANIVMTIGVLVFWILSDIVEPLVCDRFQDLTLARREAYVKFIGSDLIGYAGLLYFLMGTGGNGPRTTGILGAALYVITVKQKRHNRELFLGIITEEDEEEAAEESKEETKEEPMKLEAEEVVETEES